MVTVALQGKHKHFAAAGGVARLKDHADGYRRSAIYLDPRGFREMSIRTVPLLSIMNWLRLACRRRA